MKTFDKVINEDLPGYNNYFGTVNASIQFASRARPSPHKTRMPSYGEHGQRLFNLKALAMVKKGVLIDPYELGIQPVIVNDAWVVKKQGSAHLKWEDCSEKDVRMVTGFDPVNKYLSPIPSKASDPMAIYTSLANWKYLGELDFADMYWQLKFKLETTRDKKQLEYLCIRTIGGILAYTRGPNGLLGMDAVTDELTDKLLGDLVLEGKVVKLADNVYFGAESIHELHAIFHEIMKRCSLADLRIKPSKIHINIANADILGLHWNRGTLSPSTHKLDPLAVCEKPKTVKGLRSFLGAVRFNEICLNSKDLADATELLDEQTPATKAGKEVIEWTNVLDEAFEQVQEICKNPLTVYVPKKGDSLFLVGDAAPSQGPGIGTKLVLQRKGSEQLLPSFNHGIRMKGNMREWSACEVEAYQLAQGIKKFKPFIRYVGTKTTALVDSRATVLAVQRLEKGQPSTSRRLQDLLANVSAENIRVLHISAKLPSALLEYVDFASRNPVTCENPNCTLCIESENPDVTFLGEVFINSAGVKEISSVPKMSIAVWKEIQQSSKDLKRAAALLESGKAPHKKEKRANDIRKYLRNCTLNKDGLVVAKNEDTSQPFLLKKQDRIVIPREFAHTFATVLHRNLDHPLPTQMLKMFLRSFYMLDAIDVIRRVTRKCEYPCQAMKKIPKETMEYQTETKPEMSGIFFNADVLQESGMKILVFRENLTSYTESMFVPNEQKASLREALVIISSKLRSNQQIIVRVDAQSSLKALKDDRTLAEEGIKLDIGSAKNKNINSVAEKAIREFREEMVKLTPHGGKISGSVLAKATRNLNSRIRHTGCSARELWVKRDQDTGQSLQFEDKQVADAQCEMRLKSHDSSAKYQSRDGPLVEIPRVKIGDRIYIKSDQSKSKARDQYVILRFVPNKNEVEVQKLLDKNRKNIVRVQLQNLYKVETDDEDTDVEPDYEVINSEEDNELGHEKRPPKETPRQPTLSQGIKDKKTEQCFFCIKMRKKSIFHSYLKCESLLQINPGLKKRTVIPIDTSDSEEDELFIDNYSDNDESYGSTRSLSSYDEEDDDDGDDDFNEAVTEKSPSPPRSSPSFTWSTEAQPPTHIPNLPPIQEENSEDSENNEGSDDAFNRETVILHDGCCSDSRTPGPTPSTSRQPPIPNPSGFRTRLDGRSLPGRSIEDRNLSLQNSDRLRGSIPGRLAHTGDVIKYFTGYYRGNEPEWLQATVQHMFLTQQRLHSTYYNIMNERGEQISVELIRGDLNWQLLRGDEWEFIDDEDNLHS